MSKYKTAITNKYIDKNNSQTIEKQLTPNSIKNNYFQKIISPSNLFNSMSKSAIIQKYGGQRMPVEDLDESEIQYDGQRMPSKRGSGKIQYDGQRMPVEDLDESEIHYDGQPMPSKRGSGKNQYDGQRMPVEDLYDRQELPSSILSQGMPKIGPNILSQGMPKIGPNILSQGMPKIEPNILSQGMPERFIEFLSESGLLGKISELLSNMDDYPSIIEAAKGFTLKRAVKKRGSVRKGDEPTGLFTNSIKNKSVVERADQRPPSLGFAMGGGRSALADPRTYKELQYSAPFSSPQRSRKNFGFPVMPETTYQSIPMGFGLRDEGMLYDIRPGTSPAENAVRQSMPTDYDNSEYTQENINEALMEALKTYAGNTFNNTRPFLDATLFNGDAINNNITQPFYSNVINPLDAYLRAQGTINKRMSKPMHKKMDEDMAVVPKKISTNQSISSKNKYFK